MRPVSPVLRVVALTWLAATVLLPIGGLAKLSLSRPVLGQPPYLPTFALGEGPSGWARGVAAFTADAYVGLVGDDLYLASVLGSLRLASLSTLATLALALPLALAMASAPRAWRGLLVLAAVAPFWTSFLVRIDAWIVLLKDEGLLNQALIALRIVDTPLPLFASDVAVIAGMVYCYLPFMVLPIYQALESQDPALAEAAADLGASPWTAWRTVTLPLALPGLLAGALLVFIPALGEFVIPDLLGGPETLMIGRTIWADFFDARDWPTAAAMAMVLLALGLVPLVLVGRMERRA